MGNGYAVNGDSLDLQGFGCAGTGRVIAVRGGWAYNNIQAG